MKRALSLWSASLTVLTVFGLARGAVPTPPATQSDAKATTQPVKTLTLDLGNKVTLKLARTPAGKFMMGSPADEKDRYDDEAPQHEVIISKSFHLGVYEVTQEQYEQVMGTNPSSFKAAQNPVENVSWDDAVEFCKKISAKTGKTVRLPTEAQWEYACRAGTKTRFSFGDRDEDLGDHAWYGHAQGNADKMTHAVGQKKPNAWGLYDMHGNVWEYCSDWYAGTYYGESPKADPTDPADGQNRVFRGGSWLILPKSCRTAARFRGTVNSRKPYFGFRVVVVPSGKD